MINIQILLLKGLKSKTKPHNTCDVHEPDIE